jgi:hypothetical protein
MMVLVLFQYCQIILQEETNFVHAILPDILTSVSIMFAVLCGVWYADDRGFQLVLLKIDLVSA